MNKENFTNPSGKFIKNRDGYDTFVPNKIPDEIKCDKELIFLLSEADSKLGALSGVGQLLPNPHLLIHPYIRREAVLSSRIEGTMASLSDLFLYEMTKRETKNYDYMRIREVRNYVRASEKALKRIKGRSEISRNLLKTLHRVLLYKVRGSDRFPGNFRRIQNWLSPPNSPIEDAIFVPPLSEEVDRLLLEFENFIQKPPKDMPQLIQCALMHYQFETIHPFLDGNGRIGRLVITLFLCKRKLLSQPLLYLSAYLENNKEEYGNKLTAVREKSDYEGWVKFFLKGVILQSEEAIINVQKIIHLQKKYQETLRKMKSTVGATRLADSLFLNPYTTTKNVAQYLHVSFPTANSTIKTLIKAGILEEYSKQKRNRIFVATELIKTLEPKRIIERDIGDALKTN